MSTSIPPADRAWAVIDLAALVANARTIGRVSGARLLPMVKADGYGLGATRVVGALEQLDPWGYGVATVDEGAALRSAGIRRPIVVFTPLQPAEVAQCRAQKLRPVVGDVAALEAWTTAGSGPFHVEIDTGMGRAGFRWDDQQGIARLEAHGSDPGFEGVFTHFHSGHDARACAVQWDRFNLVVGALPRRPTVVHAANSAAALLGTRFAGDLVRPGIYIYGGRAGEAEPQAVVKLQARLVALRRVQPGDTVSYDADWTASESTLVGTLAIGYADGVPRSLGGRGRIEFAGRVVPVVGRVTMDMTMVALAEGARQGDVGTLFGGLVSLDEQATAAGTIAYEMLTGLGPRVQRRYGGTA